MFTYGWIFVLIKTIYKMPAYNELLMEKGKRTDKSVNVIELMQRAKFNEKKEKRNTFIVAAAAISVLAISGLIISL